MIKYILFFLLTGCTFSEKSVYFFTFPDQRNGISLYINNTPIEINNYEEDEIYDIPARPLAIYRTNLKQLKVRVVIDKRDTTFLFNPKPGNDSLIVGYKLDHFTILKGKEYIWAYD